MIIIYHNSLRVGNNERLTPFRLRFERSDIIGITSLPYHTFTFWWFAYNYVRIPKFAKLYIYVIVGQISIFFFITHTYKIKSQE